MKPNKIFCPVCDKKSPAKDTFFQFAGIKWIIRTCTICGYKHDNVTDPCWTNRRAMP